MPSIRLFEPTFGREEESAVIDTLRSKNWASGSNGVKVKEFEEAFAKYTGFNHCVAVNSGTAALHLALSLYDIKGKKVYLPALSFVSTANAVLYNGGIPVFCDVERDTLCLDPETIPSVEEDDIILPVNFGGIEAKEMHFDVSVVCDSAHRVERYCHNDMTCYSFHPVKNLAMPSGGAICYNGDLDELKARRFCGITDRNEDGYDVKEIGWNYYMNEISAAIGIEQLKKLDAMNDRRRRIAKMYHDTVGGFYDCIPFSDSCSYHLFWLLVDDRKAFRKKMADAGIETGIHYKPIDKLSLYIYSLCANLPVTREIEDKIVSIPMHASLTDQEVDRVIKVANS